MIDIKAQKMSYIEPGNALIYISYQICLSHWFELIPFQSKTDHNIPGESFGSERPGRNKSSTQNDQQSAVILCAIMRAC